MSSKCLPAGEDRMATNFNSNAPEVECLVTEYRNLLNEMEQTDDRIEELEKRTRKVKEEDKDLRRILATKKGQLSSFDAQIKTKKAKNDELIKNIKYLKKQKYHESESQMQKICSDHQMAEIEQKIGRAAAKIDEFQALPNIFPVLNQMKELTDDKTQLQMEVDQLTLELNRSTREIAEAEEWLAMADRSPFSAILPKYTDCLCRFAASLRPIVEEYTSIGELRIKKKQQDDEEEMQEIETVTSIEVESPIGPSEKQPRLSSLFANDSQSSSFEKESSENTSNPLPLPLPMETAAVEPMESECSNPPTPDKWPAETSEMPLLNQSRSDSTANSDQIISTDSLLAPLGIADGSSSQGEPIDGSILDFFNLNGSQSLTANDPGGGIPFIFAANERGNEEDTINSGFNVFGF